VSGIVLGLIAFFVYRYAIRGFYSVQQNERAVKTVWGRAVRIGDGRPSEELSPEEKERYFYPQVAVIPPGGPYFRWPWEQIYKVSVATETASIALDPENSSYNSNGQILEAVTKDQLNTGLTGQMRFAASESNLYAYIFGIKNPRAHVTGYFHSILREKIANFEAPRMAGEGEQQAAMAGISINDLRKNLRELNDVMEAECKVSEARYGIRLDATLITGIDPPPEVESALAAINTAHNQVSSEISLAQAGADQKIVMSKRAVEIETNRAQAEVEPLQALAAQLRELKKSGPGAIAIYLRNVRLGLFKKARRVIKETGDAS
jgi:regulator of protease activity HflC (stomatin/prohibitin superfamily)